MLTEIADRRSELKVVLCFFLSLLVVSSLTLKAQQILSPEQVKGKKVLLVVGEPEAGESNDDPLVKRHLEDRGYVVTMATESDPPSSADGQDLVMISSTADPRVIGDKYASCVAPVFTWNTVDYPDMKLTGPERHVDFETIDPEQDFMRAFSVLYGYFPNSTDPIVKQFAGRRSSSGLCICFLNILGGASLPRRQTLL